MSAAAARLDQALSALTAIGRRLRMSVEDDAALFPASEGSLATADRGALQARDAFLQRFQQAADHLLRKTFPRLVDAADETTETPVMREVLERLHRLGVVEDIKTWLALLQLRNRLSHDYALEPSELAQDLNTAWAMAPLILEQIERSKTFAARHHLLTRDMP